MMQYSQLASRQVLQRAGCSLDKKAAMLSRMLQWSNSAEQRAPQGTDPAIVLHQISCCCSFGQELMIIQINKQRGGELYVWHQ